MAQSSDEIVKREIIEHLGTEINGLKLRVFPEGSRDDQDLFSEGGLTFGQDGLKYGSCDACWYKKNVEWIDPFNHNVFNNAPVIALEGTDALDRGSRGNAQYQRFHHVLGAVKNGLIGVYYLRKGEFPIQHSLYGMAYYASKYEKGVYLIIDNLEELNDLLNFIDDEKKISNYINLKLNSMYELFLKDFKIKYGSWEKFALKRSTILFEDYVIKHAGRMRRSFTDGDQRGGHIALGEMYLTKYFFYHKKVFYLWPRMCNEDIEYLDKHKSDDKEWNLLRNEPDVQIITIDNLNGVPGNLRKRFLSVTDIPLKNAALKSYNASKKILEEGIRTRRIQIDLESII